jgi:hypothetical protein
LPSIVSCTCGHVWEQREPRSASVSDVAKALVVSVAVAVPSRVNCAALPPSALRSRTDSAPRGSVMDSALRDATGVGAATAAAAERPIQVASRTRIAQAPAPR